MPTKLCAHVYLINLYLHEFIELILFFDPIDYSPGFERDNGQIWKGAKHFLNTFKYGYKIANIQYMYNDIHELQFWKINK